VLCFTQIGFQIALYFDPQLIGAISVVLRQTISRSLNLVLRTLISGNPGGISIFASIASILSYGLGNPKHAIVHPWLKDHKMWKALTLIPKEPTFGMQCTRFT
jgi:hypothetical protein